MIMIISKQTTSTAIVASVDAPLPAFLADVGGKGVSPGISDQRDDYPTPTLSVAQAMSKWCDRNSADYIENCEPGDLVMPGSVRPLYKGADGITAIHCGQRHTWTPFLPNRQGIAGGRYLTCPSDVEQRKADTGSRRPILVQKSTGHIITETRELYLIADDVACVLFCSGTKHFFAKQWMAYLSRIRNPQTGGVMPSYSRRYRLYTVPTGNALGKWFGLKFQDEGWLETKEQFETAVAFNKLVESGGVRTAGNLDDAS
jgi:hypothetical protein